MKHKFTNLQMAAIKKVWSKYLNGITNCPEIFMSSELKPYEDQCLALCQKIFPRVRKKHNPFSPCPCNNNYSKKYFRSRIRQVIKNGGV